MNLRSFGDKNFLKAMAAIALPIALQNLITSSLNMVDTVMIGGLGSTQIAAVGLANQYFFIFAVIMFGINSGAAIFVAQFWGKEDVANIRRILGIALLSGAVLSTLFTLGAILAPGAVLRIFTEDPKVIEIGVQYIRIVALSYFITGISLSYSFACRSVGHAKLPMMISAVSLGSNTILNYLLIFGKFGFPRLEVRGAAIATVIARIIELALLIYVIYKNEYPLAGKLHELFDLKLDFLKRFFKTATPVILNEGFWSVGISMYSAAYARIGTEAIASVQISNTIQNIFMVVAMGLGNACAVMIGNRIGSGDEDTAIDYAKRFSIIGPAIGIVLGTALVIFAPFILKLFNADPVVYEASRRIIIVMAIFMAIKIFNVILIVGIFRSGGDTKFSMFLEMGSVWLVGVPLAFFGAGVLKIPVYYVVALVSVEEVVKALIGIPRFVSKRWVKNVIEHM